MKDSRSDGQTVPTTHRTDFFTDPVSQARRIGLECAGTSSEQLPFVLDFAEQAASAGAP
jgi:hypothetical protein